MGLVLLGIILSAMGLFCICVIGHYIFGWGYD